MRILRQSFRSLVAAGLLLGTAAGAGAQGTTGTITGRVVDAGSQAPVAGASVLVVGTTRGDITGADGVFTITGAAPGAATVRATRIGYSPTTQAVTVTAGGTATVTLTLAPVVTALEQVVVTATGEAQSIREQGNTIARIELPEERLAVVQNFSQAIAAQAPGVQVLQSSGTTGTGARVRIRGANSLSLANDPLIIIDGVRVNSSASSSSIDVGGQVPSRLNDINPEDIESIEILKGPAAAGLYGTQAANGVIQITTKRGSRGDPRWTFYVEGGTSTENSDYPANWGAFRTNASGQAVRGCNLLSVAAGSCVQDSIVSFNPLEDISPFRTGARSQYGLSVSGGNERTTYFVSGEQEGERGIYRTSDLDRVNFRANLTTQFNDKLDASIATGYLSSTLRLPENDNNFLGYISNGLAGYPDSTLGDEGYDPIGPQQIDQIDNTQDADRFTGSINSNWRPTTWLQVTGTAGLDLLNRFDNKTFPVGAVQLGQEYEEGQRTSNRLAFRNWTANVSAIGTFGLTPDVVSTTTLGYQFQRELLEATYAFGAGLTAGTGNLSGATERFQVDEDYVDNKLAGAILSQQFGWRDRLFVSGSIRADDNSAFGENFGTIYYPTAQASWVISEEEFFPQGAWLSSLRLRGAYGQSGLRPGNRDAITYFTATPARLRGQELPGITIGGVGDPELRPERTSEFETGFDASFAEDRVRLDVTYYNKRSRDALVAARTVPSAGVSSTVFRNLGSVRNSGIEAVVTARVIDRPGFQWNVTLNHSENRNKLEELGEGVEDIIFGLSSSQAHVEGYSLGGYWGYTVTDYADTDGDGIVDEINFSDETQYLGNSIPERQSSLETNATFLRYVRLGALLDYRGGYKQYNASEDFRCGIARCRGLIDESVSLEEQANAMASANGVFAPWIEDGDFLRLRELSLTLTAPETWARRTGAAGVSLTLAGRNLATWTDYSGVDPEVNAAGQANFGQYDFLSQPLVRQLQARLNVNF